MRGASRIVNECSRRVIVNAVVEHAGNHKGLFRTGVYVENGKGCPGINLNNLCLGAGCALPQDSLSFREIFPLPEYPPNLPRQHLPDSRFLPLPTLY